MHRTCCVPSQALVHTRPRKFRECTFLAPTAITLGHCPQPHTFTFQHSAEALACSALPSAVTLLSAYTKQPSTTEPCEKGCRVQSSACAVLKPCHLLVCQAADRGPGRSHAGSMLSKGSPPTGRRTLRQQSPLHRVLRVCVQVGQGISKGQGVPLVKPPIPRAPC